VKKYRVYIRETVVIFQLSFGIFAGLIDCLQEFGREMLFPGNNCDNIIYMLDCVYTAKF